MKINFRHHTYYFLEFLTLLFGFFLVAFFANNIMLQLYILAGVLFAYFILGVFHHELHHNLKLKIVIEYFLVGLLIFSAFLFLNSSRL